MSAVNLLDDNPKPTEQQIREGISGNFCRCTGYQHIVNAMQYAAAQGGRAMATISRAAEARGLSASSAARTRASSRAGHLRGRREDRRHAAPGLQAQRHRARPHRVDRHERRRRRWKASRRCSPARRSPSSSSRCRSARRSRRPITAPWPWTSSATPASRWPWSWPTIATSPATPPTPSSCDYDPLPAVVDPEQAMTGQAGGHPRGVSEQHRARPTSRAAPASAPDGKTVDDSAIEKAFADAEVVISQRMHEPAPGAERDGAARRRRALRAGQGHDDHLVVDAEPAHPADL